MIKSGYSIAISCNKCRKGLYYLDASWFLKPGERAANALSFINEQRKILLSALMDELTCPYCGNTTKTRPLPSGFNPYLVRSIDNIDYA